MSFKIGGGGVFGGDPGGNGGVISMPAGGGGGGGISNLKSSEKLSATFVPPVLKRKEMKKLSKIYWHPKLAI